MTSSPWFSPRATLVGWCGLCLVLAGCGTGDYEARFKNRLEELKRLAPFEELLEQPLELPGTRIKIRVPALKPETNRFKAHEENSPDDKETNKRIDQNRVHPPFMRLPGFRLSFETFLRPPGDSESPVSCYCYLAAIENKADAPLLAKELPAALKRAFPNAPEKWDKVSCDTPENKPVEWSKIQVKGPQEFVVEGNQGRIWSSLPGTFELWLYEAPDYQVLVGWRVPDKLKDQFDLDTLAKLTAGTVTIDPAPEATPTEGK